MRLHKTGARTQTRTRAQTKCRYHFAGLINHGGRALEHLLLWIVYSLSAVAEWLTMVVEVGVRAGRRYRARERAIRVAQMAQARATATTTAIQTSTANHIQTSYRVLEGRVEDR